MIFNGTEALSVPKSELPEKKGPTVIFVGRLMPVKSLQTLIQAVGLAKQTIPDLMLWIVGDGSSRAELESLTKSLNLSQAVVFWGQTMDVAPYFQNADVFAMSSSSEGLPMALLQAMSVGLPSVTTDVGGMAEVIQLSDCGLLAPIGDHVRLSEALVRLFTEEQLHSRLSRNALLGYRRYFTLEGMTENYMRLYRERN